MKVKFLGITQSRYRTTTKTNPIRILDVGAGAVVDLPDAMVAKLQRDYPKDWHVIGGSESVETESREPVGAVAVEDELTKGDESPWTRKKSGKR